MHRSDHKSGNGMACFLLPAVTRNKAIGASHEEMMSVCIHAECQPHGATGTYHTK